MANFAVAASPETIERANKIMEMYARTGDKKEDILLRILDLAESESIKGTHPELEGSLKAVDSTIATLIKQINGIVAGQDIQIIDLKEKLNTAIEEKRAALEQAKKENEEAQRKADAADAVVKQAQNDIEEAITKAQNDIQTAKKEADTVIEKANIERDQAIRERDDARTIASEKTASNDLLMRQIAAMETDIVAYKELQENHKFLQTECSSIKENLKEKENENKELKKELDRIQTDMTALQIDYRNLISENAELRGKIQKMEQDAIRKSGNTELDKEKAIMKKEREIRKEYQDQIRLLDKENARLQFQVEQMQDKIAEIGTM